MAGPDLSEQIRSSVALIVDRLSAGLNETIASIQSRIAQEIGELRADPQLVELLRTSVTGNVETFLALFRHGIGIDRVEPPTAALEYARRLAQHGIPVSALLRAYRLGQYEMVDRLTAEVREARLEPDLMLAVLDDVLKISFSYIDWISQQVTDTYEDERERWLEYRNSVRGVRVRELLSGDEDVDTDAAASAIGYPLRGAHVALILSTADGESPGHDLLRLERFTREVAESLELRHAPLFVAVDRVSAWVWLALDPSDDAPSARIRRLADHGADSTLHIAVGTVDVGVAGFRRSHQRAQDVRKVALIASPPLPFVAATDPGLPIAALLADNIAHTRRWVLDTLGPLAASTENDARLRHTLRIFLQEGSSYTAAAEHLMLHHNSVRYRVNKALERRGRPIAGDRIDVELALLACHLFHETVLRPATAGRARGAK